MRSMICLRLSAIARAADPRSGIDEDRSLSRRSRRDLDWASSARAASRSKEPMGRPACVRQPLADPLPSWSGGSMPVAAVACPLRIEETMMERPRPGNSLAHVDVVEGLDVLIEGKAHVGAIRTHQTLTPAYTLNCGHPVDGQLGRAISIVPPLCARKRAFPSEKKSNSMV